MLIKSESSGLEFLAVQRKDVPRTALLLHGFGASMDDLSGIIPVLDPKEEWNWIVPNGVIDVPLGPNYSGKAWFPIRASDIEKAAISGSGMDLASIVPQGMTEASVKLREFLEGLKIKMESLVLAGFSQGAMLSVECALSFPAKVAGVILFSGTLVSEEKWRSRTANLPPIAYYQSHGMSDSILSVTGARRLNKVLVDSGWVGTYHEFKGFHEIPPSALKGAAQFLHSLGGGAN
ncbi:MAG: hypothetical protein NTV34_13295 [Proteobacteria bacterium]|nr:hypothetical protein [Pseudomonadota bacterium]